MTIGRRDHDGRCSVHGDLFIQVVDEKTFRVDCGVCTTIEHLEARVRRLQSALEELVRVCDERKAAGQYTLPVDTVKRYAQRVLDP